MSRTMQTVEQFVDRVKEVLREEADRPRLTWWLSFADATRPKGQQFLGTILVDPCPGLATARMQMILHGVPSPGGEIQGVGLSPSDVPPDQVAALARLPRLTLLSKADLRLAGIQL